MPATLIVQTENGETIHPVEVPVLRIGSAADCDIRIDGIDVADHLLTIEYRDRAYIVYNRSTSEIFIDNKRVAAGESHALWPGLLVTTAEGIRIELEVEGNPAPAMAGPRRFEGNNRFEEEREFVDSQATSLLAEPSDEFFEETDKQSVAIDPKTMFQIGVIISCLAAIVAILVFKLTTSEEVQIRQVTPLLTLVGTASGDWESRMAKEIQRAEAFRLRGQLDAARNRFFRLRDELERYFATRPTSTEPNASPPANGSHFAEQARTFVHDRIWQLQAE